MSDLITVDQAAARLDLTVQAVYTMIKQRRIMSSTVFGRIVLSRDEVTRVKKLKVRRSKKSNGHK